MSFSAQLMVIGKLTEAIRELGNAAEGATRNVGGATSREEWLAQGGDPASAPQQKRSFFGVMKAELVELEQQAGKTAAAISSARAAAADEIKDQEEHLSFLRDEMLAIQDMLNNARVTGIGLGGGTIQAILLKELAMLWSVASTLGGKEAEAFRAKLKFIFNQHGGNRGSVDIESFADDLAKQSKRGG